MSETVRPRSLWIYVWAALVVVVLGVGYFVWNISYTIHVTEAQAQKLMDAALVKFRATHPDYTIDHATVHFANDMMTVSASGSYTIVPKVRVASEFSSTGNPVYDSPSVHFDPSELTLSSFTINGKEPSDWAKGVVTTTAAKVVPTVQDELQKHPKIAALLQKHGITADVAQSEVGVAADAAAVNALIDKYREPAKLTFESWVKDILREAPLYTLGKNWKEQLALATLSEISIKDGVFTATLTGAQLLRMVLTFVFAAFCGIGLLVTVLRSPVRIV